jgi:growth arrest and DNA-damage-inducible protein
MVIDSKTEATFAGSLVKKALVQAKIEHRLIVGLSQIGRFLAQDQVNIPIFCLMTPPRTGDCATHMHEVLLKAYCLENDIYIVELDSAEKFNRILESPQFESCALICANPAGDSDSEGSFLDEDFQMTKSERKLVDYCEDHWNDSEHSTIRLPEK